MSNCYVEKLPNESYVAIIGDAQHTLRETPAQSSQRPTVHRGKQKTKHFPIKCSVDSEMHIRKVRFQIIFLGWHFVCTRK